MQEKLYTLLQSLENGTLWAAVFSRAICIFPSKLSQTDIGGKFVYCLRKSKSVTCYNNVTNYFLSPKLRDNGGG